MRDVSDVLTASFNKGDMTTQVTEITERIVQQVREEQDRFIFETITPYIKDMTKMVISKKILCRALQCFQEEHFEEYMALKKESEETWNL